MDGGEEMDDLRQEGYPMADGEVIGGDDDDPFGDEYQEVDDEEEEDDGEDLLEDMERDYRPMPQLDTYEDVGLAEEEDYDPEAGNLLTRLPSC